MIYPVVNIEYILRVWVSDLQNPSKNPWKARLLFIISAMAIVDLWILAQTVCLQRMELATTTTVKRRIKICKKAEKQHFLSRVN